MASRRPPIGGKRQRLVVEALEPRLLYSADFGASLLAPSLAPGAAQHQLIESETISPEIVFVDAAIPDAERLITAITAQRDVEVIRIGTAEDGVARITEQLALRSGISAVHIISHGSAGAVQLGTSTLDAGSVEARAAELLAWRSALSINADVLFYGCDVAESEAGRVLLQRVAGLTGADVAASVDPTGHAARGGDWDLEFATGTVETRLATSAAIQGGWFGLLASVASGGELQVPTTLSDNQTEASVAMDANGNFVVVWTSDGNLDGDGKGIFAQRFDASGTKLGAEVGVNTTSAQDQVQAAVAMDANGNYVVVWSSDRQDPDGSKGVYGQRYNAVGVAQGGEFRINSTAAGDQVSPSVAMNANGDFTVAWTSNQSGTLDVYARRYNAAGTALGAEMLVNTTLAGQQTEASVAMDASGNFIVVWTADQNLDGDGKGVFAQRFDASGTKLGSEVRVNTQAAKDQMQAAVAMAPDGSYVVAWTSQDQDSDRNGIFAKRFNAAGVAQGGEFQVNTYTHDAQDAPAVAIDSSGRFTVVWQSNNQDGGNKGIYAQSYDEGGFAIGSEFRVNATTASAQAFPAISMRGNGDFVVAWQGVSATDSSGIAARLYRSINQAPVNLVPGAQVAGGAAHVFSTAIGNAMQVTDVDAGGGLARITLTASNGTLTLGQTAGLTFSLGDGAGDGVMTFDGTLAAVNAALDGLSFTATQNFSGMASVQIFSSDLGYTGSGGALTDTDTVTLTVTVDGTPFILSGSYSGNAVDNRAIAGLGFTPDVVVVKARDSNKVAVIRTSDMSGDASKPLAGGTALSADLIQSLDANGFTIGVNDSVNELGKTYDWIAFKASAGFLTLGSYAGDGVAGRTLSGLGLSPDALFVFDGGNEEAVFTNSAAGGNAFDFGSSVNAGWIPSLTGDGFTVGNDNRVNALGRTYYYVAWNELPGLMDVGGYTGDGLDNRNIGGLGLQPEWVVVKNTAGDQVVQHFDSQGAALDSSSFFTGNAANTNRIQQLQADGFQVGADNDVNASGKTYTYMAFRQETAPTISNVADQSTTEGVATSAIAFTVGDGESAAGSLSVMASSSDQTLVADAGIVIGGSGANRTVTITPAAHQSGTVTITLRVSDGYASTTDTFVLTVDPLNEAPTVATPSEVGVNEDQASALTGISFADFDAGSGNVQASFSVAQGALSATSGAGVTVGGSALNLTLTGSIASINAFIAAGELSYTPVADDVSPVTLQVSVNDLGNSGAGGALASATSNVTLNVTPINDAPINSVAGAQSVNEDGGLVFSSGNANQVSVADIDSAALEVTLAATQGTISLAGTAGLTFSAGDGTGDTTMTFRGSAASINAALNGMSYTPTPGYSGPAALSITTSDLGNTGEGDVLTDDDAVAITVNPVNDAPTGADNTIAMMEDTSYVFSASDFGFADEDGDVLAAVRIATLPPAGTLTNNGLAVVAGQSISAADIAAGLLRFAPAPNASGVGYASFTFQVQDDGGTANAGADLDATARAMTINVATVNNAPVLSGADDLDPIAEDAAVNDGTPISALIGGHVTDADAGAIAGIAVVSVDDTNGTWQYSLDAGASWTDFGTPSTASARLLAADASTYVRFVPDANWNGTVTNGLTFRAWDRMSGVAGATADTTSATQTFLDQFGAVSYSNSDGTTGWSTGWVDGDGDPAAGDIRVTAGRLVLSTAGNEAIHRQIDLSAASSATLSFGYDNQVGLLGTVDLQVSSNGGATYSTLATFSNLSNPGAGSYSTDISAYMAFNTRIRFAMTGSMLGGTFSVDDVQLSYVAPLSGGATAFSSATASSSVVVTPVNDAPAGADKTVTTMEDAPYVFAAADFGFTDGDANALAAVRMSVLPVAGTVAHNGVAVTAGQLVSAADIAAGLLRFTPAGNASGAGYASFEFQVQDDGGTADGGVNLDATASTITINVTSVNDAPAGANNTVTTLEDTAYVFTTADFGFSDTDGNTFAAVTVATLPGAGALTSNGTAVTAGQSITAAQVASGLLRFAPAADATGTGYASFTFQLQDDGGTANGGTDFDPSANTITINVTSVNDAPAGADNTVTTLEDTPYVFTAADFGFSDADGSALAAVTIMSLPGAGNLTNNGVAVTAAQSISIADIAAGQLRFAPAADASGTGYASFTFQVQDDGGTANGGVDRAASANTVTINVTSVNDAPAGANSTVTTLEDTPYVFTAADFGFTDGDGHALVSVTITTLPAAGSLANNGVAVTAGQAVSAADIAAGLLRFTPAANANGPGSASFSFQVQDDGGTASGGVDLDATARTMTIDLTAVNDAPTGANNTVTALEDTPYVFTAADFGFSDSDGNAVSTVTIATLPGAGALTNNGVAVSAGQAISAADIAAGLLRFTPVANANGAGYASFTFQVQDDGGTANGGIDLDASANSITINVTAVNDAPAGANTTVTTLEDTAYVFSSADFGFSDSDGNALAAVTVTTLPGAGSLSNNGVAVTAGQSLPVADISAGLLRFTPTANANGAGYASFTFQVQDDGGTANGGVDLDASANSITINVTAVNDAPVGVDTTISTPQDTTYVLSVADFGFSDIEAHALLAVRISSLPSAGTLTHNGVAVTAGQVVSASDIAAGRLQYVPMSGTQADASFTFRVQDSGGTANGGSDTDAVARTMTVNVTAPVLVDAPAPVAVVIPPSTPPAPWPAPDEGNAASGGTSTSAAASLTTLLQRAGETARALLGAFDVVVLDAGGTPIIAEGALVRNQVFASSQRLASAAPVATQLNAMAAPEAAAEEKRLEHQLFGLVTVSDNAAGAGAQRVAGLSEELNRVREEVAEQAALEHWVSGTVAAGGFGLTVGYVLWLLRGGALIASLLSSLPVWRLIDPLPIVSQLGEDEENDEDEDAFVSYGEGGDRAALESS